MIPDEMLDEYLAGKDPFENLQKRSLELARSILLTEAEDFNEEKIDKLKVMAKELLPKKWVRQTF